MFTATVHSRHFAFPDHITAITVGIDTTQYPYPYMQFAGPEADPWGVYLAEDTTALLRHHLNEFTGG
jgi:hypothetical protein